MNASTYYYDQLNKNQQKAYYAIKEGLEEIRPSFMVPKLSNQELSDIYFMIRMDNPFIFYSVTFKYRYYEDSSYVELIPEYLFKKDKILEHRKALLARVGKLAGQIKNINVNENYNKILFIHDFICGNVKYDKLKKEYSHEIIGALTNGVAVCEGIAKAVKVLCDAVGIWCILALAENNPEKKIKYRHAWNIIKLDGKYYHFDVTFDNTVSKNDIIRYDYVCLSDKQIFRDHEKLVWRVPECTDGDHFYYKDKKLSWTTLDEVRNRTKQAVKKGKILVFHWRGGYLTREVLKEICDIFREEAKAKGKIPVVSANLAQAVVKASFQDNIVEEQLEIEETNEGENYQDSE